VGLEELLQQLDGEQRTAVTHGEGPLLVVAGAGSGKTRVLTFRIAYLLATGMARPDEILAVTFTNKAAGEMAERVTALIGTPLAGGFVGTFHRFALQLLRRHPREAGLPQRFAIADEDDQRKILDRILKRLGISPAELTLRAARSGISRLKNTLEGERLAAAGNPTLAAVWEAYQEELRRAGAIDFDDMLVEAVHLLEAHPAIRSTLAARYRWLLVDEYQDTNAVQARLLRLLGGPRPNLTAVGDEDQAIYRFRGARVENILRFEDSYPDATVVTLPRNYRSTEPILRVAAAVIANNLQRRPKQLRSEVGSGGPVTIYQARDETEEASFVADEVEAIRRREPTSSVAVLFRINAQSRPLESELVRRAIPYVVVGGVRFWERAEVRDALAYLRLLVTPDDTIAFRRAIQVPARGIGGATLDLLEAASQHSGQPLPAVARQLPEGLTPRAHTALARFFQLLRELSALAQDAPPARVVETLLLQSGLAEQYRGEDEEDRARRANLDQLVAAAAEAGERGLDVAGFLDEVALLSDADVRAEEGAVVLSTLHAAKGLEFDTVFLTGLEDGLLPLRREGRHDPEELEEERRLAYVGMTRARRRLVLVTARVRRLHGQLMPGRPSPFLLEIPRELVENRAALAGRDPFRLHLPPPGGPSRGGAGVAAGESTGSAALGARSGSRSPHPDGWRPGLKVRHPTFGSGVILQVQAGAAQTRLVIFFDRVGRKTLIPSLAKLERA
jgi:DNA helicase-2/ATP-dependent DNA helicase PcrA